MHDDLSSFDSAFCGLGLKVLLAPRWSYCLFFVLLTMRLMAQQQDALTSKQIFDKASAATVVILAGEGAGRLHSIATGVLISKDGVVLTALHAVKGAAELQVRLANGEVFDQILMTGSDERRDIAALKIPASGVAFLSVAASDSLTQGDPVYAVTNANGLTGSATEGIVSAIRPADEVPGAGSGFRLFQFTAPVAPGASGGALLDKHGALAGIITKGMQSGTAFAIPIESVIGLPNSGRTSVFGSGSYLQMPVQAAKEAAQESAAVANADPKKMVKDARTIYIYSKTSFLTVDTLDRALLLEKRWPGLKLTIVQDERLADLVVQVDRPLFTYIHTFVLTDKKTTIVLGSGKVTAFDGSIASSPLARQIIDLIVSTRQAQQTPKS